jgi:hypothetical protein
MAAAAHVAFFRKGDHICLFYRSAEEQLAELLPFVEAGLSRNERCFCAVSSSVAQRLSASLQRASIKPEAAQKEGALVLATPEESYLCNGSFNPENMIRLLENFVRDSLAMGFDGFRAAGDLGWAAGDSGLCARLREYESIMARFYPNRAALGLCMYDVRLFTSEELSELMRIHRFSLTTPTDIKRAVRLRRGNAFGDIIFDRDNPALFHYTVQKDHSREVYAAGQESSLQAAWAAVESSLGSFPPPNRTESAAP